MNHTQKAVLIISSLLLIMGCGKKSSDNSLKDQLTPGKGGRNYGGVFRMNESEYLRTLFPPSITDAFSYRIANQVYEGLLKFDQEYLTLKPGLAEKYEISPDGLVYTFYLKKGVFFHDDPCFPDGQGREVTASDIKYCFDFLCSYHPSNMGYEVVKNIIKGADDYYQATKGGAVPSEGVSGIRVLDEYTVQVELQTKNSLFLYDLARPFTYIYPKEAWAKYSTDMRIHPVGTGAFYLSKVDEGQAVILKKFEKYYGVDSLGNKLPFLDALEIRFIGERKAELLEFKKGNLDMIYRLPTDEIIEILEQAIKRTKEGEYTKYIMQREPEMSAHYLMFNLQDSRFKNKYLRKALSFAIDRTKILEYVLQGEGFKAGVNGITPPTFEGYDIEGIQGYGLNLDSARHYLKKAGYTDGSKLGKIDLELNADGDRNVQVAQEIQKQLKDNLNVEVNLLVLPFAQHLDNCINGKTAFFRLGWLADYPNPENFLYLYYGANVKEVNASSFPNLPRYSNSNYDMYYEAGLASMGLQAMVENFKKAEQILMNDAPVIVLWYDEGYRLLQPYVRNFPNNPMQYRDLSDVYFGIPEPASEAK